MAGTAFAGAAISVIKRSKPCGLMRSSVFSMMIASAARTAASLTNSVREEPRKSAARSMIAMSCSGRRIDKGYSFFFAGLRMLIPKSFVGYGSILSRCSAFYNTINANLNRERGPDGVLSFSVQ